MYAYASSQALYKMGVLYHVEDVARKQQKSVAFDLLDQPAPFIIRPSKRLRPSKRMQSAWQILPLHMSMSDLSHDPDIEQWLSPSIPHTPIHDHTFSDIDIPLSLPAPSALRSAHGSTLSFQSTFSIQIPIQNDLIFGDWTFIDTEPSTPLSLAESETWTWE